ncbi:MAG: FAD-dependent oxidoreductase [Fimbriimonadaceae bacterium]
MADVVVVGAGPAGLAAAAAAAEAGARVRLVDDNAALGGQIWRAAMGNTAPAVKRLEMRLANESVEISSGLTVFDAPEPGKLSAKSEAGCETITYERLVIATGARELFLPFPGWTLPGVMGAGGAQALLKSGANFGGKRVVVSGAGPLLLAVGASFAAAGANVVGVFEQASLASLARFAFQAMRLSRLIEGVGYLTALGATPYSTGTWVAAGSGSDRLEAVVLTNGERTWNEPCDLLASAYGLVPNCELASLVGCEVLGGAVAVDDWGQTTVSGVYAAGEPIGIGGLDLALAEGDVAGKSAAGVRDVKSIARAAKLSRFRAALDRLCTLRPEIRALATPETILCRCEDVRLAEVDPNWSAREAKLCSRVGMGPCQGRICGPATRWLFGWDADRTRPPLYPTEVNMLAASESQKTR